MTTETTRHTSNGMHTRLVATAADVISRAMQQGRSLPAALAVALDSACLLQSPDTAAELARYRDAFEAQQARAETLDRLLRKAQDRVAELEAEAATQRRKGYQVAIDVMRQEKLPMSVGLLEAQLELEVLDTPEPEKRPTGGYPPALPWAKHMDADDLEGFLADLTDAASGDDDLTTLDAVESVIATWRVIAEAQHAHNTAPGPAADDEGMSGPCDCGEGAVHYTTADCPAARRAAVAEMGGAK